ncbi:NIPSNAP family protein [Hyalangium versicolor]|uniref:NIPSNAP family protein n=1 Tax=Hyalangium versicolor TaxID=2861190 RepID=UPI001CCA8CEA|nr:NIPSNAP family protein [Hyalangium versicolor]
MATAPGGPDCTLVELRQYTLHPRQRDTLIELFDREFVESQEALGMRILGQFRDLDRPDRFVWLRGFPQRAERARALAAFYGGPVWKRHREAANATMVDSTNVLQLAPTRLGSGFERHLVARPPVGATEISQGEIVATVYSLESAVDDGVLRFFEQELKPAVEAAGIPVMAHFKTEASANDFPALPVREGENVLVWFSALLPLGAYRERLARLKDSRAWSEQIEPALKRWLKSSPEILRLSPTARSSLRA